MSHNFRQIFKEIFEKLKEGTEIKTTIQEFSFGWIKEEELWKHFEPFHGRGWRLSKYRPFMVVKVKDTYVYFILFSTTPYAFPCDKDRKYGIEGNTPEMSFERCILKDKPYCEKLKEPSKLFKRRIGKRKCVFVMRLKRNYFENEENVNFCGFCSEKDIPEKILRIIKEELKEWENEGRKV